MRRNYRLGCRVRHEAIRFVGGLVCALFLATPSPADAAGTDHVTAKLLAETTSVLAGEPFRVALMLEMAPHWHTYWTNPGDSGLGTTLDWDLPQGFKASLPAWPFPQWLDTQGLASFAYEGSATAIITIMPPERLDTGTNITFTATASWLECKELCLPGDAELSFTLPVGNGDPAPDPVLSIFAEADRGLPVDGSAWPATFRHSGDRISLSVDLPDGIRPGDADALTFFPHAEGLLDLARRPVVRVTNGVLSVEAALSESASEQPERLSGVLVAEAGWMGLDGRKAVAVEGLVTKQGAASASASPAATSSVNLPTAAGLAFMGGLILNLMPCVFPVISLKILGFVHLADSNPGKVWRHGLVFAAGVLVAFWGLAGLLLALKAAGQVIGWGFQLQSPGFVAAMAILFLLIALSLLGVFEIGGLLTGAGGQAGKGEGWSGSFLSGVLATVVATPCTAPFMGVALGFALTQPAWVSMTVFTFMGLGMATPYLFLSRFPGWLSLVPKPGPWMESLKQGMGFLVLGFALYLVWVFAGQRGTGGLGNLLTGLLMVAFGAWVYGRWGAVSRGSNARRIAAVVALGCLAGGYALAVHTPPPSEWEPYSAERLAELRAAGKPVFIDFTAAWCVTCQANKKIALNREHVQDAFRRSGVTRLKADWTDRNDTVTRALESYGRSGVPTYVLYGRGADTEPRILPETLTAGLVLEALNDI